MISGSIVMAKQRTPMARVGVREGEKNGSMYGETRRGVTVLGLTVHSGSNFEVKDDNDTENIGALVSIENGLEWEMVPLEKGCHGGGPRRDRPPRRSRTTPSPSRTSPRSMGTRSGTRGTGLDSGPEEVFAASNALFVKARILAAKGLDKDARMERVQPESLFFFFFFPGSFMPMSSSTKSSKSEFYLGPRWRLHRTYISSASVPSRTPTILRRARSASARFLSCAHSFSFL
ncbi:hypothetical protein U1Q18_022987 [Sarracenia purpurea var. burkii]